MFEMVPSVTPVPVLPSSGTMGFPELPGQSAKGRGPHMVAAARFAGGG